MKPERRIIACAIEAEVLGVWAVHHGTAVSQITHVPTGRKAFVDARRDKTEHVWRELARRVPKYGEEARFGENPTDVVGGEALAEIIAQALGGLSR